MALILHIFKTGTRAGAMAFDTCMGTGPTTKAFLMKQVHRNFTGSDGDGECVEKMKHFLLETIASQILNNDSDILENAYVDNATTLFLQHFTTARSSKESLQNL